MKIKFVNVTFYYNNKLPDKRAVLNDLCFEINNNEFIGLIGPSGSGKTTLVQHFTGLLQPGEGKILINDINISDNTTDINLLRRQIGIVFQFPESQLFEETVYNDVAFGPKNFGLSENQIEVRIKDTFDLMGLDFNSMRARSPFKLSEGEKRRVALAGVISMNPEILILDEPTACLDTVGIRKIEQLLTNLFAIGKTIILVSHNLDFVAKLCKRIILLKDGRIGFDGSKEEFFKDEHTAEMLNFKIPRIIRYSRKLYELGYISKNNLSSAEEIKLSLGVS